ncbi:hypothetical protein BST61_g5792 [Cercospora zeina]
MSPRLQIQFKDASHEGPSIAVDFRTLRALVMQNQSLQHHLAALATPTDELTKPELQRHANGAVEGAAVVDQFVSRLWSTFPTQYRFSEKSAAKAQQVFNTPELLENILSNLPAQDLLMAQQTNTAFLDTINDSSVLKKLLGLEPDPTAAFYSPFEVNEASMQRFRATADLLLLPRYTEHHVTFDDTEEMFRGLYLYTHRVESPPEKSVSNELFITVQADTFRLRVGSRCLQMLICQPPVKQATIQYRSKKSRMRLPGPAIHSSTPPLKVKGEGLTVGDILIPWKEGTGEHDAIYHGPFREINMKVQLDDDDPIMHQRRAAREEYLRTRE